jgi:IclR family acetate operon transcriptional repressor
MSTTGLGNTAARTPQPGVIAKLTQILDLFVAGPDHLRLDEVATLTGQPRSTTARTLTQLVDLDWLEHDERGYALGPRMRQVGRRVEGHLPLRSAAADPLHELHAATSAVVHLAILDRGQIEMVDKIGGVRTSTIPTTVGTRYPAETAVVGRAMLASLPPEQVDQLLTGGRASGALHDRLNGIRRRRGFAVTTEDMPWDLRGIGAAILGPHGPVGAISVGLPGRHAPVERFAPLLARAVQQTTDRLKRAG